MTSIPRVVSRLVFSSTRLGVAIVLIGVVSASAETPAPAAGPPGLGEPVVIDGRTYASALALLESAVDLQPDHPPILGVNVAELRPGSPSYLRTLARLQTMYGRSPEAIATLNRLARMGIFLAPDTDDSFSPLRDSPDFRDVARRLRANRDPLGSGQVLFELPAMTGIVEGIAFRAATGEYLFGDVLRRCVWLRRPDGSVRRFSPVGAGLLGVFGLAVDEARGSLWAATTALPEMEGYRPEDRGRAALVEFALADGSVRRSAALPWHSAGHVLGDLSVAADGTVYATDSYAPVIWRLPPGAAQPERWIESREFKSLQGVAVMRDGSTLVVSDYSNGVFLVDRATGALHRLTPPPDATLAGIDGLAVASDGSVVAVQNGTDPRRVIRLWIDSAARTVVRLDVLERGHAAMADPTLGTVADGRFVFVGNAGWERFAPGGPADAANPRAVPIMATPLSSPTPVR